MESKLSAQEIELQRITDAIRQCYFNGPILYLEFVPVIARTPENLDGRDGRYNQNGSIELSYELVSRDATRRKLVILHELIHCLVHRKHGWLDERDGHSNWFLF